MRGEAGPLSDLDVFVDHTLPWRPREQRRFHGVPAELFVNPPERIRGYFGSERSSGRPSSAHMFATGVVVHATDPVVHELVAEARASLASPPVATPDQLVSWRYEIVDLLDDARDATPVDPVSAALLLGQVAEKAAAYAFRSRGAFLPRRKETATALAKADPEAAALLAAWGRAGPDEALPAAEALVRRVIGVDTFFDWISPRD